MSDDETDDTLQVKIKNTDSRSEDVTYPTLSKLLLHCYIMNSITRDVMDMTGCEKLKRNTVYDTYAIEKTFNDRQ